MSDPEFAERRDEVHEHDEVTQNQENAESQLNSGAKPCEEDEECEELDPRVKVELECLNNASEDINHLESELEMSHAKFGKIRADAIKCMESLYTKNRKTVEKARPYYVLHKQSTKAHKELQRTVIQYQQANSLYQSAKETVALAEESVEEIDGDLRRYDDAWQEMLNHATEKFVEATNDKEEKQAEHMKKAAECEGFAKRMLVFEKDMPRTISRAKPYFDQKSELEEKLEQEKMIVEDLQLALKCAKMKYRNALTTLEEISEDIHRQRNLPERTPGVGAETNDSLSDLPSINLEPSINEDAFSFDYKDSDDPGSIDSFHFSEASAIPRPRLPGMESTPSNKTFTQNTPAESTTTNQTYTSDTTKQLDSAKLNESATETKVTEMMKEREKLPPVSGHEEEPVHFATLERKSLQNTKAADEIPDKENPQKAPEKKYVCVSTPTQKVTEQFRQLDVAALSQNELKIPKREEAVSHPPESKKTKTYEEIFV